MVAENHVSQNHKLKVQEILTISGISAGQQRKLGC
jgi:hypothetical protein